MKKRKKRFFVLEKFCLFMFGVPDCLFWIRIAQFRTFSQRLEDIDIDVYHSLGKIKAEPSEGSSFFRECLVEWRV